MKTKKVVITHDPTFNKEKFPFIDKDTCSHEKQPEQLKQVRIVFFDEVGGSGSPESAGIRTHPEAEIPLHFLWKRKTPPPRKGKPHGHLPEVLLKTYTHARLAHHGE